MASTRLCAPAYANELRAAKRASGAVNLHAHIGARNAWKRAQRSGHRPRLVIDVRGTEPEALDLTCCDGLELVLNASDCDVEIARTIAMRMCEHGARMVVLLHRALPSCSQFIYGVRP